MTRRGVTGRSRLPVVAVVNVPRRSTNRWVADEERRHTALLAATTACAARSRPVTVFSDDEWQALVRVLGTPAWCLDERFVTMTGRVANQDELDRHLSEWTRERDRHEIMHTLQQAGVTAGAVQDARDVNEHDPQMAHRDIFFELDHPVIGEARFEGVPFTATNFGADHWRSAPLLGEDNHYVLSEVLGLDHDEIADLEASGVL